MSKKRAFLALWLDAPLQSWGYQSRFDRRASLSYPTRSGVLGLVCAALGIERGDADGLRRFESLRIEVLAFPRVDGHGDSLATRVTDYHTVGGGYDPGGRPYNPSMVPKASGSKPDPVVTYREYLADTRFGVLLGGERKRLGEIDSALCDPRRGVWLGRKCCIPAARVTEGVFDSREEAVARLRELAGSRETRSVREVDRFDDGSDTLMDMPRDFEAREFGIRRVLVDDNPT